MTRWARRARTFLVWAFTSRRTGTRGLRFTREGRVFVLVTLGIGAAAINTGNNLLYLVLGLMLSLIILSGILSDLVVMGVRIRRSLPSRAFAGTAAVIELTLWNKKAWLPSFSLEVEDQAEREATDRRCYFLKVAPHSEQTAAYRRTPSRRGVMVLTGFRLSTRYPFGLFEKWRLIEDRAELLVYPALLSAAPPPFAPGAQSAERGVARVGSGPERIPGAPPPGPEVAGLRDYRDGDELRIVHARRSASLGRLVVREREREAGSRWTIVIDEARPSAPHDPDHPSPSTDEPAPSLDETWDEAFELMVSRAASMAARALEQGISVDVAHRAGRSPVVLGGGRPDPIFAYLALLQPIDAMGAPPLPSVRGPAIHLAPAPVLRAS